MARCQLPLCSARTPQAGGIRVVMPCGQSGLARGGHPPFWPSGTVTARRWERSAKSTVSTTIPIVTHQL